VDALQGAGALAARALARSQTRAAAHLGDVRLEAGARDGRELPQRREHAADDPRLRREPVLGAAAAADAGRNAGGHEPARAAAAERA
jgi:hypothetical protein